MTSTSSRTILQLVQGGMIWLEQTDIFEFNRYSDNLTNSAHYWSADSLLISVKWPSVTICICSNMRRHGISMCWGENEHLNGRTVFDKVFQNCCCQLLISVAVLICVVIRLQRTVGDTQGTKEGKLCQSLLFVVNNLIRPSYGTIHIPMHPSV
jgi:hypothetical protein